MAKPIPPLVIQNLAAMQINLEPKTLLMLQTYLQQILQANQQFNLTAIKDWDQAWHRLIVDSLSLLPFLDDMKQIKTLVDVGTGAGLPGLTLAIARPELKITLVEATGKKARFCQEAISQLDLKNVAVLQDRAENLGHDSTHRQQYDLAVCRALGPMRTLLEYTSPLVRAGGQIWAMKGPKAEQELDDAANAMDQLAVGDLQVYDAYPENLEQNTVIVILTKLGQTPSKYPRPPGTAKHDPL